MTGFAGDIQPFPLPADVGENPPAGWDPANYQIADTKVSGRSNLYIGDGSLPSAPLYYFGEQIDDTPIQTREFYNDVPGDSQGGPQGPPIDRQVLGRIISVSFTLSSWSQQVRIWLEQHNGYSTVGKIEDWEVGSLLLRNHSFRVLIVPIRNNPTGADPTTKTDDHFTYNFPSALLSTPIEINPGSKFSTLRFTMEAHRGHPGHHKPGVLWDRDITQLPAAQQQQQAMLAEQMKQVRQVKQVVQT